MKLRLSILLSIITILLSLQVQAQTDSCDRACLDNVMNQYLDAIVNHDPDQAPLTSTYRHTENSVVQPLGDGMWGTVTAMGAVQRHYIDEVTGSIVFYGIMMEGLERAIVSLRLQVVNEQVNEAEWFIGREGDPGMDGVAGSTAWDADYLTTGNPPLIRTVPEENRSTREELIYITNAYWDGIVNRNPNISVAHPGCYRDENGQITVGRPLAPERLDDGGLDGLGDCRSGTNSFNVANIVARRWAVVDVQAQVVVASALFIRDPGNFKRRNHFSDVFYIDNGKLRGIYTAMYYAPSTLAIPNWAPYEGNFPLPVGFGESR